MSARSHVKVPATGERRPLPNASRPDSIESLELRLVDGYHRIEVALAQGNDVITWEDFWIELLRNYEALCDDVRVAA